MFLKKDYHLKIHLLNFKLLYLPENQFLQHQNDFVCFFFKKGLKKKSINILNNFAWKNTKSLNQIKYNNLDLLFKYNTFYIDALQSNKKWKKRKNFQKIVPIKLNVQKRKKILNIIHGLKRNKINDNFYNIFTKNIINLNKEKDFWNKQFINYYQPLCSKLQQRLKFRIKKNYIKKTKNKLKYKQIYNFYKLKKQLHFKTIYNRLNK